MEELSWLASLEPHVPLAARVWIPASVEASFYRLNQLEPQIADIFGREANDDPDEDEIEDLVPEVQALLASHVLDDLVVEAFHEACSPLPPRLHVRQLGTDGARVGFSALRGRPALLALRSLWKQDWELDAVTSRLRRGEGLMPHSRTAVLHADDAPAGPPLSESVSALLGVNDLEVRTAEGLLTRVMRLGPTSGGVPPESV